MKLLAVIAAATTAQAFAPTRATTPTVCRGGGSELQAVKNSAFVFVKPHAVTPPTIELVKSKLTGAGLTILSEGDISSEDIDQKKLVDQHYYAIASKATITPPAELAVPDDKFTEFFGESWSDVLSQGRAFTAIDACKELGLSGSEMDEAWGAAKGAGKIIKLGGGFYAGQLAKGDSSIYTFNAFYMSMRDRFTQPGGSIHYFAVEWDASTSESSKASKSEPFPSGYVTTGSRIHFDSVASSRPSAMIAAPNASSDGLTCSQFIFSAKPSKGDADAWPPLSPVFGSPLKPKFFQSL